MTTTESTTTETRRPFTVRAAEVGGKVWTGRNGETRVYFGEQLYARVIDDVAGRIGWNPVGRISTIRHQANIAAVKARLPAA